MRLPAAVFIATLFGSSCLSLQAEAGGFAIRSHSAAGFGMALSGVAAGDQLSYSYWNPAVLGNIQGFEIEAGAAGVLPFIDIYPENGASVEIGKAALVPSSFAAMQLNDQLTMGIAFSSPFGMATEAPNNWAGQIYSRKSEIFSLNANPMLAYRVNDHVTIGAGLQFQYFSAELGSAAFIDADAPDLVLDASDYGFGFNFGVQLAPWEGTVVGLGYRSSIKHDLDGDIRTPLGSLPVHATIDTPDIVSLGIRQDIGERFRAFGTVEWNNWSRLQDIPAFDSLGNERTTLYLRYRDGWLFSVGGEYDVSERLTLRAGLGYEISPLTVSNRDTRFPETNQLMVSAGASYQYSDRVKLTASYIHSFGLGDGAIDIGPDNPRYLGETFTGTSDLSIGIASVGINVKLGALGR